MVESSCEDEQERKVVENGSTYEREKVLPDSDKPTTDNEECATDNEDGVNKTKLTAATVEDGDPKEKDVGYVDFETAVDQAGYGKFHYFLLAVCGFVSTSEEMDVISMSFILPSAQCDLNLTTHTKGWLNCIIFIGMMGGAYVWGSVADSIGRKKVLIVISLMNGVCIIASSFSQNYMLFMIFRFLNGAALGGSGPVIWSYFAEFQPKSKRGAMLSFMAAFWTLGNLFVAGMAWMIIPLDIGFSTENFKFNSWRIFLLLCAGPSFIVACLLLLLPESPKFLVTHGDQKQALCVFQRIYSINNGKDGKNYPVKMIISDTTADCTKCLVESESSMLKDILANTKELFVSPILRLTVICIAINFTFHIGYYGLMMWFPELFDRFQKFEEIHPNISATVCDVTSTISQLESHNLCSKSVSETVFMHSLITVASAVPSNIFAILCIDRLGRKFFLVFSTFVSGLCAVGMYFVNNSIENLVVSAVFSSVISSGNAALDCLITEVFPTKLRATGVAISMVAARLGGIIGNIVIAMLLDLYCPAPTFIVAVLLIGGGLLCLFLPNTTRVPLS